MVKRIEPGFVWVPHNYSYVYKIKANGSDITDSFVDGSFTKGINGYVGTFKLRVYGTNLGQSDTIEVYVDNSDASTLKYKGIIENVKDEEGNDQLLKGAHVSNSILNRVVTESYTKENVSNVISELADKYIPSFTKNNIESIDKTLTASWAGKPLSIVISQICKWKDIIFYIDDNKDIHLFNRGSKILSDEAIVEGDNLIKMDGIGYISSDRKNKVTIQGEKDNQPVVATAKDQNLIDKNGLKEEIIKDNDISSYDAALTRAKSELSALKNSTDEGKATTILLPDLKPGWLIWVSFKSQDILSKYELYKYTIKLPAEESRCYLRETRVIPQILRNQKQNSLALEELKNPHKLEQSYVFSFEDSSKIIHSDTAIEGNSLVVADGYSSGTATSDIRETPTEVSEAYVRYSGTDLGNVSISISTDGGITYQNYNLFEYSTLSNTGNKLKIKIDLNSADASLSSLSILYQ